MSDIIEQIIAEECNLDIDCNEIDQDRDFVHPILDANLKGALIRIYNAGVASLTPVKIEDMPEEWKDGRSLLARGNKNLKEWFTVYYQSFKGRPSLRIDGAPYAPSDFEYVTLPPTIPTETGGDDES